MPLPVEAFAEPDQPQELQEVKFAHYEAGRKEAFRLVQAERERGKALFDALAKPGTVKQILLEPYHDPARRITLLKVIVFIEDACEAGTTAAP